MQTPQLPDQHAIDSIGVACQLAISEILASTVRLPNRFMQAAAVHHTPRRRQRGSYVQGGISVGTASSVRRSAVVVSDATRSGFGKHLATDRYLSMGRLREDGDLNNENRIFSRHG
jgi:hypothetical protein